MKICTAVGFIIIVGGICIWIEKLALLTEDLPLDLIVIGSVCLAVGLTSLVRRSRKNKSPNDSVPPPQ